MPGDRLISTTEITTLDFSVEPAFQIIESLLLLARFEYHGGLSPRLLKIRDKMSERELKRNRLVAIGFFGALFPLRSWDSFPEYMEYIKKIDPRKLQTALLDYLEDQLTHKEIDSPLVDNKKLNRERLLKNQDEYIDLIKNHMNADPSELDMEIQAHSYLSDPPAMQDLITEHLEHMWECYLKKEWEETYPLVQQSVDAFNSLNQIGMSRLQVLDQVADGRLVEQLKQHNILDYFLSIPRIILIPSPHLGPYYGKFKSGDTLWYLFGAHLPALAHRDAPELDLADVNMRLSALADDTRLRILQFIARNDDKSSGEVIQALQLSQSAASRHLKQLAITGYLKERKVGNGKNYSLNKKRIRQTLSAVEHFLLG